MGKWIDGRMITSFVNRYPTLPIFLSFVFHFDFSIPGFSAFPLFGFAYNTHMAKTQQASPKPEQIRNADLPADLEQRVEAALLSMERPMTAARLAEALGEVGTGAVNDAVASLNKQYEKTARSFRIEQLAGGWQILTLPKYAEVLELLHKTRARTQLSVAALETLAIIAYKQPVLRTEIETIRGVVCGEVIRSLLERNLVKIAGRAEEIGRPMLYGTTSHFLEVFGLASLKDLPKAEVLKADL